MEHLLYLVTELKNSLEITIVLHPWNAFDVNCI